MKEKDENKDYFSTSEVAKSLHISRIAVFRKIQSGVIPAKKIGRNYAIAREDLEAALGSKLTDRQRSDIRVVVTEAAKQYRDAFEKLAKE